jgi:hypothetical protein
MLKYIYIIIIFYSYSSTFGQSKFVLEIQNKSYVQLLISTCNIDADYFNVTFENKIKEAPLQIVELKRNSKDSIFKLRGEFRHSFPIQITREVLDNEYNTIMHFSEIHFVSRPSEKIVLNKLDTGNHFIETLPITKIKNQDDKIFELIKNHFAKGNSKFNGLYFRNDEELNYDFFKNVIQKNPKSYIPLWYLIMELETNGFSSKIKDLLQFFNEDIQSSELLSYFKQKIHKNDLNSFTSYINFNRPQKYTLYEYWATWCGPCIVNLKELNNLGIIPNLEVYLICTNNIADSIKVDNVFSKHKLQFENHYLKNSKIEFEPTAIPFSILVNNESKKIEVINPTVRNLLKFIKN